MPGPSTLKCCAECLIVKPLDQFHRQSDMKDGHQSKCAECRKSRMRAVRVQAGAIMKPIELTAVMRAKVMGRNYKHVTRVRGPNEALPRTHDIRIGRLSAADIGAIYMRQGSGDAALIPSRGPFKNSGAT